MSTSILSKTRCCWLRYDIFSTGTTLQNMDVNVWKNGSEKIQQIFRHTSWIDIHN